MIVAGIPIKPFGVAKARLGPLLDDRARATLGKAIALHTATVAAAAGAEPVVVTGDDGVAGWARRREIAVLHDPGNLDAAARAVARHAAAAGRRWAVVHADLPLIAPEDLAAVFDCEDIVLAPSHDGGTNVVTGTAPDFPFSYGPGSYVRHLAAAPGAVTVVRRRLAQDLDTPHDLELVLRSPHGRWLDGVLPSSAARRR